MKPYSWLAVAALILIACCQCNATQWSIQQLGMLPENAGYAVSINNRGQVLCSGLNGGAFLWNEQSGVTNLGICGSAQAPDAINNNGQIVGLCNPDPAHAGIIAVVLDPNGHATTLTPLIENEEIYATAINDSGIAVGSSDGVAVLWDSTGNIMKLGGGDRRDSFAECTDINNSSVVTWNYEYYAGDDKPEGRQAYRWDSLNGSVALPALSGTQGTWARAINAAGQIVGYSDQYAVVWDPDGSVTDLGFGIACDINIQGQIVGYSDYTAVLWNTDGTRTVLPCLDGETSSYAFAVNDLGQIVGRCGDRAVLWQPVPEPSSLAALLCGLTGAGTIIRRRKS